MKKSSKSVKLVVFIDDDDSYTEFYDDALIDAQYDIKRIFHLTEAIEYIRSTEDQPLIWLVDLMMPVEDESLRIDGESLMGSASLGLASGRVLYRQIRKRFPNAKVILLTNVFTPAILNEIKAEMDDNSSCESKMALMPSKLVELIDFKLTSL